jgi:hypothetical protein
MNTTHTYGPAECRVTWEPDDMPFDWGDVNPTESEVREVELKGVWGCVVELRPPACACCGLKSWQHAASLWGVDGDPTYCREVERDLMAEAVVA